MQIIIKEPETGKLKALNKEQFDACHDIIVAYMNAAMQGRVAKKNRLDDAKVIAKCAEAGCPIKFG